jgi:hypothetical protein
MKTPIDITPKPRTFIERIGNKEWHLEERELDVFDDVVLWNDNPRLIAIPFQDGTDVASANELELEQALQRSRGYDNLRKSIEQIGQMESIYAWRKDDDTKYLVFEGATRVAILRELSRKRANGPEAGKHGRVKAKVLPPEFGEMERVILLARIHVRGSGVRAWGRFIEAKFIHDHVTVQTGQSKPLMSVSEMANHMEKSISWVQRLKDAYEFARHFEDHVDNDEAKVIAAREFSTLEEISKSTSIGPKLREYNNQEYDSLRAEVFDMVKNEAFSEYRDARFMKDFYEDPEKWALLKSGEKGIAKKLAAEVKTNASGIKAKIASLEQNIQRVLDRGDDHGLDDDDVEMLRRAQTLIQQNLHPGIRPFLFNLGTVTKALSEASLADVKALDAKQVGALKEAVSYFNELVQRHNPEVSAA